MKKSKFLVALALGGFTMISCSNSTKPVTESDSAVSVKDSSEMVVEVKKEWSEEQEKELKERINYIYQQVAESYADITSSGLEKTEFFSSRLKSLWNKLPDDDLVIDFDPYINAQDYNEISVEDIEVRKLQEKRAEAKLTVDLGFSEPNNIVLRMVKERDENNGQNWMIDDFVFEAQKKGGATRSFSSIMARYVNVE